MSKAFGIVNFAGRNVNVEGMQMYRPLGAFSFLGRYRVVDFPISNMTNSGIDHIQVYIRRKPRSLVEHLDVITTLIPNADVCKYYSRKPVWTILFITMISLPSRRTLNVSRKFRIPM